MRVLNVRFPGSRTGPGVFESKHAGGKYTACRTRWRRDEQDRVKNSHSKTKKRHSIVGHILVFLAHQFVSTLGIGFIVALLAASTEEIVQQVSWQPLRIAWFRVFEYRPYFPLHIAIGLAVGYQLAQRWTSRLMVYVWFLPVLLLAYAMLAIPTLTPDFTPRMIWSGVNQSPLAHYLGWGCQIRERCFDQILITMPFYAAAAYSLGALLGQRAIARGPRKSDAGPQRRR